MLAVVLCLQAGAVAEDAPREEREPYRIVDTGQIRCYDARTETTYPKAGTAFFGQDAQYQGHQPAYVDNGDGTVTDRNTGLMWQAAPGAKRSFAEAVAGAAKCRTGGHDDWRLPSIKELHSLILFSGVDPDPSSRDTGGLTPFVDTLFFRFEYGRESDGDRIIDSQYVSSTRYVGTTMGGSATVFGVNFADGRIKGYPEAAPRGRGEKLFCVLYVRGNRDYGRNDFKDNGDGTVMDRATGLTWMQVDSGALKAGRGQDGRMDWQEALAFAENLKYAGHDDWRLPNAKELQSIVDYSRSPDTTDSAAIDPVFESSAITNEGGKRDYAHYWTSTTHVGGRRASSAVYIAFGRALGFMGSPGERGGKKRLMDVHGAGAQRSDDKSGDPGSFPQGRGPQGDVVRIENLVRCVRGGRAENRTSGPEVAMRAAPDGPEAPADRPEGPGGRPPSGEDFVRRLDRNGDGKVSRSEFDGPAVRFDEFDRNGDGFISAEEAPRGPPPRTR
jgi:hypothetical protein